MPRVLIAALGGGAAACLYVITCQAGPVTLNVRPGLWEMTVSDAGGGPPPIPPDVLARLTPEQRAKFATAMATRTGPHVFKSCVTEKSLQRGFDTGDSNCTRTVVSSNTSTMEGRVECTNPRSRMIGTFRFEAAGPTTMDGAINLTINGPHTMTMKRVIRGKWVGADCGQYARENE